MSTKRLFFFTFVICLLIFAGCGSKPSIKSDPTPTTTQVLSTPTPQPGIIIGTITDGKRGPALADVTVIAKKGENILTTTVTDSNGRYSLTVSNGTLDIVAAKAEYACSGFQGLCIAAGGMETVDLALKKVFNSNWSTSAPHLAITGINAGDYVNGLINVQVALNGENDQRVAYIGVGGETLKYSSTTTPFTITVDTNSLPDGSTFFYIVAYDLNNNSALTRIPIIIANGSSNDSNLIMSKTISVLAITEGSDMQYDQLSNNPTAFSAQANSACYVYLEWEPEFFENPAFKGYDIYRSNILTGPWHCIGFGNYSSVKNLYYAYDTTSAVTPGVSSYYKVVPIDTNGHEGIGTTGSVIPLGRFEVDLVAPSQNATGVSLTPTFYWSNNGLAADNYEYDFRITNLLSNATGLNYVYTGDMTKNCLAFVPSEWGVELRYDQLYQWDITNAYAETNYSAHSMARSYSYKSKSGGSNNGAFVFSTNMP